MRVKCMHQQLSRTPWTDSVLNMEGKIVVLPTEIIDIFDTFRGPLGFDLKRVAILLSKHKILPFGWWYPLV